MKNPIYNSFKIQIDMFNQDSAVVVIPPEEPKENRKPRKPKRKFWERVLPVIKLVGEIVITILTLKKKP